jgi:Domain of unknown function (DUF4276)
MSEDSQHYVNLLVEGLLDEAVLQKIIQSIGGIQTGTTYGKKGKQYLKREINRWNRAAVNMPFVCLVDLDDDPCPSGLIEAWLPEGRQPDFLLRVAVHMVEAWLLADRENMAAFLGVALAQIPAYPDREDNPKQALVNAARRSSKKAIKQSLVPAQGSTSSVGTAYMSDVSRFVIQEWNITNARRNSPSLNRALDAVQRWATDTTP